MSLWKIAWRSIRQRFLASFLTAFSMGLGVALVITVLVIHNVVYQSFRRGAQGYDLIVGAKGSSLQLVLNTVFHLSEPLPNIPHSYYMEFLEGRFRPAVETAIPVCMGHDYKGYPAVATIPEMFEELRYLDDREYRFAEGRNFYDDHFQEAVIGSVVARRLNMKIGDTFEPMSPSERALKHAHGHEPFTVVGILEHTGTPNDQCLFLNIEGFWRAPSHTTGPSSGEKFLSGSSSLEDEPMKKDQEVGTSEKSSANQEPPITSAENQSDPKTAENPPSPQKSSGEVLSDDHDHDHATEKNPAASESSSSEAEHDHDHDHEHAHEPVKKEVSAILLRLDMKNKPLLATSLAETVNKELLGQAVHPAKIIQELFQGIVGNVQLLLMILAILVVIVSGIGVMVSIYNSMSDRKHEIAIMRALGASRGTVMAIILLESILLAFGGGFIGLFLGHGLIGILGPTISDQTGVIVGAFQFQTIELVLIPGLILLATLVGYLPAVVAYRTDVAKSLHAGN